MIMTRENQKKKSKVNMTKIYRNRLKTERKMKEKAETLWGQRS